jgi:putative membrane protein
VVPDPFFLYARCDAGVSDYHQRMGFLIHWLVVALALWATAYIVPGITFTSWVALALAALVLGLVNAIVRPVLVILTLPITVLTLGLFYLVVNGVAFGLAAYLVPGFRVATVTAAILGALATSVISWFFGIFLKRG